MQVSVFSIRHPAEPDASPGVTAVSPGGRRTAPKRSFVMVAVYHHYQRGSDDLLSSRIGYYYGTRLDYRRQIIFDESSTWE